MGYNDNKISSLININVKLTPKQDRALSMYSGDNGVSKQEIVRKAINLYLTETLTKIAMRDLVKVSGGKI